MWVNPLNASLMSVYFSLRFVSLLKASAMYLRYDDFEMEAE